MNRQATLVVVGGGAAGFFCAVNAARMAPDLHVLILEKTDKLLSKVRISGGGRCNVTHACFDIAEMSSRYPRGRHFVRKAFHHFFTTDTIRWFRERGVELKTEADGRMFPVTDNSSAITGCLLREASQLGVDIRLKATVTSIRRVNEEQPGTQGGHRFRVCLSGSEEIGADYVCIATGGFPKPEYFTWIAALGHSFEPPVPSLFTLNAPGHPITALMGVSVADAEISFEGTKLRERGPILVTHWGLSGPAVLRLSAWGARVLKDRDYTGQAFINWLPAYHVESMRSSLQEQRSLRGPQAVGQRNPYELPQRLWSFLLQEAGADPATRWSELPARVLNKLAEQLCRYALPVSGKTTFKEEFVTAGGVRTAEVEPHTMESRIVPGMFFAGEILDVDGITGGYNFQHAWTSGYLSAAAIAASFVHSA